MAHAAVALASGDGLWTPAYATSATAAELEQQAFTVGEGPCYDALHRHAPVLIADLESSSGNRWPIWSPAARAAGIRSVAAFPIQAGAIAAGVLTGFSVEVDVLRGRRLALALRLADTALLGLLDVLAGLDGTGPAAAPGVDNTRSGELADVVRAEVHQAAGMIMAQADIPIEHALARLRARAFQLGRPLAEVASAVLARRIDFASDRDSAE
jgi:hypothetical protein